MNRDNPLSKQAQGLADVMGSYRYEMTAFESDAWTRIIDSVPEPRFMAFLAHHYSISAFAPKPADATRFLDLAVNPDVAFATLEQLVKRCGPYQSPGPIDDILVTTIVMLGGWVAVNEKLPDSAQATALRQFRERFDACFTQALVQVRINKQLPTEPLMALGTGARQALLGTAHEDEAIAPADDEATAVAPPGRASRAQRYGTSAAERAP